MTSLDDYYNSFNEEKRLNTRHGKIEFMTSMKYIHDVLDSFEGKKKEEIRILDLGAGTGRYSIPLSEEGYDVTAVEPAHPNLGKLRAKGGNLKVFEGNALKLKRFAGESFDLCIMFGPMYHIEKMEDKKKAILEAKRVTRKGGYIMPAYMMNEYAVLSYGFMENKIKESISRGQLSEDFRILGTDDGLYSFLRIEDLDEIKDYGGLELVKRYSSDGPANYMRRIVNAMDEETYDIFVRYLTEICERKELFGYAAHIVDILKKK